MNGARGGIERDERPFNIILLGDPASGKGTQSEKLARRYGMYDLDMGREVKRPENLRLYDYAHTTAVGKLTPTAVARKIFLNKIAHTPAYHGIVFSGNPKMIGEAKLVARLLRAHGRRDPLFIYLHIPVGEVLRRMRLRVVRDGGKLVKRDDDNERALANRRRYYREQVSQVVEFFKGRYEYRRISGLGTEAAVAARIEAALARHREAVARRGTGKK